MDEKAQEAKLFEDQIKAKTHGLRAWKGPERLSELQMALVRHVAKSAQKSSGFYFTTPEVVSRPGLGMLALQLSCRLYPSRPLGSYGRRGRASSLKARAPHVYGQRRSCLFRVRRLGNTETLALRRFFE